eukprot:2518895-Prymnesium_polylepis.1
MFPSAPPRGSAATCPRSGPKSLKSANMAAASTTERTDAEWRAALGAEAFHVLRERGTEPANSGEYNALLPEAGHFACRGCARPLYAAASKFASGCGWPAFSKSYRGSLILKPDLELFNFYGCRVELVCSSCGSHLGHVFRDTTSASPTGERHCVNSLSIRYVDSAPPRADDEAVVGAEYEAVLQEALKVLMGAAG